MCLNLCNVPLQRICIFHGTRGLTFGFNIYWNRTYNFGGSVSGSYLITTLSEPLPSLKTIVTELPESDSCCCRRYGLAPS